MDGFYESLVTFAQNTHHKLHWFRGIPALLSSPDVVVLGAGVIGLSLSLELQRRGYNVALHDPRAAATQASWAAAGMLAVRDPHNPPQLSPMARLSAALYPAFLRQVEELSGQSVPFQTSHTIQHMPDGAVERFPEFSLDPRQLALALVMAVRRSGIALWQPAAGAPPVSPRNQRSPVVVHASGAWATASEITPRKGQMLRVHLPNPSRLVEVHRSEAVYVVPRTQGPQAGTALIGATVEDVGFNTETVPDDLAGLRRRGAALIPHVPELADSSKTPMVEAWAGLRPATPDGLPLLGEVSTPASTAGQRHFIAGGHFRNGILLAPATAVLIADLVQDRPPAMDLVPFSPTRFACAALPRPEPVRADDIRSSSRDNRFPPSP